MPFTAPTAANKPRSSAYQLLKPTALSSSTRIQAGEFFVYKSVLQVTSCNLRAQPTFHVAASDFGRLPGSSFVFSAPFSLAGSYFPDTCYHTFHSNGDRKVHALKQSLLRRLSF